MTSSEAATTRDTDRIPAGPGGRRGRRRAVLGIVLALALVASAGVFGWALAQRRGEARDEQAQRELVMAQAEQFMLRVNTYGPELLEGEQMPEYRASVSAVITSKFDTDFLKNVPANEQVVSQSGLSRTCTVYATGVSVIDEDSATALVAGAFVNSYPESPGSTTQVATEPAPFRVEVKLVRTDGTWLVDDFDPVTGTDPAPAPTADTTP